LCVDDYIVHSLQCFNAVYWMPVKTAAQEISKFNFRTYSITLDSR